MKNMSVEEGPDPSSSVKVRAKDKILKSLRNVLFLTKRSDSQSIGETIAEIVSSDDNSENKDSQLFLNVANMTSDKVEDVMVPRSYIAAINIKDDINQARVLINSNGYSRIPVYQDSLDNIKGFVHIKDVLLHLDKKQESSVEEIMRRPLFVPPSMRVVELLRKMHTSKIHIAIVIDEYGGTDGLVTLEDLTEQILGEFEDDEVSNLQDGGYEVNARIRIEDLEEKLKVKLVDLDDYDFDTLAGYIVFLLGRIPTEGEVIDHESGMRFIIKDAEPRYVKKVIIEVPKVK